MSDNFFASIIEAVNQLNSRNGEVFLGIGQNLFQQIAIGMLVLHGIVIALDAFSEQPGAAVQSTLKYLVLIAAGWLMLQGYNTPIPGLGNNFHGAITSAGPYLTAQIETGMQDRIVEKFQDVILASETPSWTDWFNSIPAWFHYQATVWTLTFLGGLMSAVIGFGPVAQGVLVLFGPVFIPFALVPKMDWVFWGWLSALIQYTFYGPVAQAFVFVYGNVIMNFFARNPGPYTSEKLGQIVLTMVALSFALVFGIFKISGLVADMFRGSSGIHTFPGFGKWKG